MSAEEREAVLLGVEWLCTLAAISEALGEAMDVPEVVGRALDAIGDVRAPQRTLEAVH